MQLSQNTQKLLEIIPYLSGNIVLKTKDSVYQAASNGFLNLMRLSLKDVVNKTDSELFANKAELAAQIRRDDQVALAANLNLISFYELPFGNNKNLLVEYNRYFVFNQLKQVESFLIDIKVTTSKEAKLTNTSLEDLFKSLPAHVYLKDVRGVYLAANDRQAQSAGFQKGEDIIGKTDYDLYDKEGADEYRQNDLKAIHLKKLIQDTEILKNKGNYREDRIFLTSKIPFYRNGKIIGVLGISTDITKEEKSKRETELYLKNLLLNLPGHIYWKDKQGRYLGCNKLQALDAGFNSFKEIIGKTDYELSWKKNADAIRKADAEVIKTGKAQTFEEPLLIASNKKAIFFSEKIPLKDDQGEIIGVLGISMDITESKETQKQLAELQTREAHFKAMSVIGGIMAHELRTPLMSIGLNAKSIKEYFPILVNAYREYAKITNDNQIQKQCFDNISETANDIEQAARYASNTITTILSGFRYSSSEMASIKKINVKAIIEEALKDYPSTKEQQALITFDSDKEYSALGSASIIIHVLHNLLKNSLYAIQAANKGKITISVKKVKDHFIDIIFKDTGKGIPKSIREHIFEPFYTTKDSETSIGLGLYFCKIALAKMDASISCDAKENEYTIFIIRLKGLTSEEKDVKSFAIS